MIRDSGCASTREPQPGSPWPTDRWRSRTIGLCWRRGALDEHARVSEQRLQLGDLLLLNGILPPTLLRLLLSCRPSVGLCLPGGLTLRPQGIVLNPHRRLSADKRLSLLLKHTDLLAQCTDLRGMSILSCHLAQLQCLQRARERELVLLLLREGST